MMRAALACAAVVALTAGPWLGTAAQAPSAGGVVGTPHRTQNCTALAPAGWSATGDPRGATFTLLSPDHSMYAGWGVLGVETAKARYYGPLYGDPLTSIKTLAGYVVRDLGDSGPVTYTSAPQPFLNYFMLATIASARTTGLVFYKVYPLPNDAYGQRQYVESVYFALGTKAAWATQRHVPVGVAVSIRCQTQLVPSRNIYSPSTGGSSGSKKSTACAEGNLRGYNKELGTQWAHTAAGTPINFDISDWRMGPEGEGYYAKVGNEMKKLELGFDDGC